MKIVHVIWSLEVGGAESMLVDIINEQSKTDIVHLIIINNVINKTLYSTISRSVTCHTINRHPGSRNPLYFFYYNYILLNICPNVIHFHSEDLYPITHIKSSKLFLTVHNTNIPPYKYHKYDRVFSISDSVKNDIFKQSGIVSTTIYNGIHANRISVKTNYSFSTFKIVQISRLSSQQKGQHILLEALAHLIKQRSIHGISIDFIGDGESKMELIELSKQNNIYHHCHFLGRKDRQYIYDNLKNYDLLVQPSLYEGFGLTIVEAMAAKVPVLVSDIEGPIEIIQKGKYGDYFKSGTPSDCAEKLSDIMRQYSSDVFLKKITDAYTYVLTTFDIKTTSNRYLSEYRSATQIKVIE